MNKDRGSTVEIIGQLLRRIETLAVDLSLLRAKHKDLHDSYNFSLNMERQSRDAVPQLREAIAELERLKKKHPKLVRLPNFMRDPPRRRHSPQGGGTYSEGDRQ